MLAISLEVWICSIIPTDGDGLVAKSCPTLGTPWTVACQAPLSMGFPRQEYWSRLPFLTPGDLLSPGIKAEAPALAGRFFIPEPPGKPYSLSCHCSVAEWCPALCDPMDPHQASLFSTIFVLRAQFS